MFCTNDEVIFIHSKQVDKTGPNTLIVVSRGVIESVNPEFAPLTPTISVQGLITVSLLT